MKHIYQLVLQNCKTVVIAHNVEEAYRMLYSKYPWYFWSNAGVLRLASVPECPPSRILALEKS